MFQFSPSRQKNEKIELDPIWPEENRQIQFDIAPRIGRLYVDPRKIVAQVVQVSYNWTSPQVLIRENRQIHFAPIRPQETR